MLVGSKDAEPQLVLGLEGGGGEMWASLGASEGRKRKHLGFGGLGRMHPGKKPPRKERDGGESRLASRTCFMLENRNRKKGEDL